MATNYKTVNFSLEYKPEKGRTKTFKRTFGFAWVSQNYLKGVILKGKKETCLVYYSKKFSAPIIISKELGDKGVKLSPTQFPDLFGAIMKIIGEKEESEAEQTQELAEQA